MTMAWRSAGPLLVTKDPPVTGGSSATTNAAAIARSDATPEDCADAIQTSPLTKPIAPSESTVLCIQTSADDASKQGVSQKLARISIKSVNKEDVVTALVSAWNVPS
jgi:hypothetical protein